MKGRPPSSPLADQLAWKVLYLYHRQPTTQIAEEYGVSYSQVRRALLRLGVPLRPPGGRSHRVP